MSDTNDVEQFDVLIEGTSLKYAILATALSIAGLKIVHVDQNDFYGGINACIAPPFDGVHLPTSVTEYKKTLGNASASMGPARDYNIEIFPRLLYTSSSMIRILQSLGIGEYVQFKSLNSFHLFKDGEMSRAPSSKEDIFTSTTMPLIVKRRLMKFIKYCGDGDHENPELTNSDTLVDIMQTRFRLDSDMVDTVAYALAGAWNAQATLGCTLPVIQAHLRSLGLFGPFPVVIPMYGSGSELTQAFCRKAAVKGCTYILGQSFEQQIEAEKDLRLSSGHQVRAQEVITRRAAASSQVEHRRTVIAIGEFHEIMNGGDGACIAFPPNASRDSVIQCQIYGSGAGTCPPGQSVIYLSARGAAANQQFDAVCSELNDNHAFETIVQLDYDLNDSTIDESYEDLIDDAKRIFVEITKNTKDFLPKEPEHDSDQAAEY